MPYGNMQQIDTILYACIEFSDHNDTEPRLISAPMLAIKTDQTANCCLEETCMMASCQECSLIEHDFYPGLGGKQQLQVDNSKDMRSPYMGLFILLWANKWAITRWKYGVYISMSQWHEQWTIFTAVIWVSSFQTECIALSLHITHHCNTSKFSKSLCMKVCIKSSKRVIKITSIICHTGVQIGTQRASKLRARVI